MRISDWSSDVCSSDLLLNRMTADVDSLDAIYLRVIVPSVVAVIAVLLIGGVLLWLDPPAAVIVVALALLVGKIGRASCSERVCPYVYISVVAVSLKKQFHNDVSTYA